MLEVGPLDAFYGDSHVLHGVRLSVGPGEGVALLGRNGAGKSTLLKALLGAGPRATGPVAFEGRPIEGLPTHRRARLGLSLVPEDRRIYGHVTVAENLALARHACPPGVAPRTPAEVAALFPLLAPLLSRGGARLSGGQQQMVAVGRGLVPRPKLLLLDEPAEGLAPLIVEDLAREIARVRRAEALSLLVTEQNVDFARACTDRLYLIDSGVIVFSGDWAAYDARPELETDYLAL
ncbi:High-affinity branched-chain amino acid transport ATP-binding protein LivF [Methylobacterium crusticola]|uniref:High-affinity branched-chain amino acid transport ATP-binding protein LivF n=1 Tax=Methylobacterium crusticola TaxID=1697972 RepID=A0ABQ4R3F4_9HYPH|nr:ABC transporter ATP-binding protein [Methylobacterium crusticola]GJD52215.1 High-affinity branched-chain amino acid transport ATP-binding protein LivF [Methylobacterium crusticola]